MNLASGPLTTQVIDKHIRPLFSRVLKAHEGIQYLANHSLGRPLDASLERIAYGAGLWADKLDEAWSDEFWSGEMATFRESIARLLCLEDAKGVVPKTSAGQGLRAVLNSFYSDRVLNVVSTRGEFDSIDFILKTYAEQGRAQVLWAPFAHNSHGVPIIEASDILNLIDDTTDLVVVSAVMFGTGQILQGLQEIIDKAHRHGALVVVDVYHALGVFPFSMRDLGMDFCIGGCYKYLRGGPGACYLAIGPWILESGRRTLDTGWFAKKDTFSYLRPETAETWPGGDGWLESTPPVLTMYQATPGLEFTLEIGVQRIREYSLELLASLRETLRSKGLEVIEPLEPEKWGAFALVHSERASALSDELKLQGIVTDARGEYVRFGPDLLSQAVF